jgi:hypothetical protein
LLRTTPALLLLCGGAAPLRRATPALLLLRIAPAWLLWRGTTIPALLWSWRGTVPTLALALLWRRTTIPALALLRGTAPVLALLRTLWGTTPALIWLWRTAPPLILLRTRLRWRTLALWWLLWRRTAPALVILLWRRTTPPLTLLRTLWRCAPTLILLWRTLRGTIPVLILLWWRAAPALLARPLHRLAGGTTLAALLWRTRRWLAPALLLRRGIGARGCALLLLAPAGRLRIAPSLILPWLIAGVWVLRIVPPAAAATIPSLWIGPRGCAATAGSG